MLNIGESTDREQKIPGMHPPLVQVDWAKDKHTGWGSSLSSSRVSRVGTPVLRSALRRRRLLPDAVQQGGGQAGDAGAAAGLLRPVPCAPSALVATAGALSSGECGACPAMRRLLRYIMIDVLCTKRQLHSPK